LAIEFRIYVVGLRIGLRIGLSRFGVWVKGKGWNVGLDFGTTGLRLRV